MLVECGQCIDAGQDGRLPGSESRIADLRKRLPGSFAHLPNGGADTRTRLECGVLPFLDIAKPTVEFEKALCCHRGAPESAKNP
jgi:hypothetical protein